MATDITSRDTVDTVATIDGQLASAWGLRKKHVPGSCLKANSILLYIASLIPSEIRNALTRTLHCHNVAYVICADEQWHNKG